MGIIIDTELFTDITNETSNKHGDFKPVVDCIAYGKGKLVYGGHKYEREVNRHSKFLGFLVEMRRMSKTFHANDRDVDFTHCYLKNKFTNANHNDHHIVAIQVVSGCKLVCTIDKGLHSLIKDCYVPQEIKRIIRDCPNPGNLVRPKIYQNRRHHQRLLNDANITL